MTDIVRATDTIYAWESCTAKVDLVPYTGIRGCDFSGEKRERKPVRGMNKSTAPLGKPSGKYTPPTLKLKMLRDSWEALKQQLTAKALLAGGASYGTASFNVTLTVSELVPSGVGPGVMTISATGCTVDGVDDTHGPDDNELVTELEIGVLTCSRNGQTLYDPARGIL